MLPSKVNTIYIVRILHNIIKSLIQVPLRTQNIRPKKQLNKIINLKRNCKTLNLWRHYLNKIEASWQKSHKLKSMNLKIIPSSTIKVSWKTPPFSGHKILVTEYELELYLLLCWLRLQSRSTKSVHLQSSPICITFLLGVRLLFYWRKILNQIKTTA